MAEERRPGFSPFLALAASIVLTLGILGLVGPVRPEIEQNLPSALQLEEAVPAGSKAPEKEEPVATGEETPGPEPAAPDQALSPPRLWAYTVQPGDNLWRIARRYGVDVETLVAANDLADLHLLRPGQKLWILTVKGAVHRVRPGESLWEIARLYRVPIEEIVRANALTDPTRVLVNQRLIIPGGKPLPESARRPTPSRHGRLTLHWPLRGRITSWFGKRWGRLHEGIDIAAAPGSLVRAAAGGKVVYAGWAPGYGQLVILNHGGGLSTYYGHNGRLLVRGGQVVQRGEALALSGNTGRSTGPHLHFEVRLHGRPQDPLPWLRE
ncbi:MAG: peptidoglycan DD-metalloendopeptidase family protein [Bacillota bacterium]|nr:peptidoglycan DD-metalloendopeptidase family protein [Bacillota bacterium]